VHLPQEIASFFDALRGGIRQAGGVAATALEVEFHSYPGMGRGEVSRSARCLMDLAMGYPRTELAVQKSGR